MVTRRGFLGSLVALVVAPFAPTPAPMFHRDTFSLAMEPLTMADIPRLDVLYGFGCIAPYTMVRVGE